MSPLGDRWMFSMFNGCARHFRYALVVFASLLSLDHHYWGILAQQSAFSRVFEPLRLEEILGGPNQWRWQQTRKPFGQMFYYPAGDYWRYFGPPFGYQGDYYWNSQLQNLSSPALGRLPSSFNCGYIPGLQPRPSSSGRGSLLNPLGPLPRPYLPLPKGRKTLPTPPPTEPSLLLEEGGSTSLPLKHKAMCHQRKSDGRLVCEFRGRSKKLFDVLWKIVMEGWDPTDEESDKDDD